MKKIYLLILIFISLQAGAANPVPNPSFENWTAGQPDGWMSFSTPGYETVTQVTTAHSGTYAVKGQPVNSPGGLLTPVLIAFGSGTGFPITQKYSRFDIFYQSNLVNGDEIVYTVAITTASGTVIGGVGGTLSSSKTSWTYNRDTIDYWVDSVASFATITFTISNSTTAPSTSSYFIIDDVSFTGLVGVEEINGSSIQVFPVPARDHLAVKGLKYGPTELTLADVTGRLVLRRQLAAYETEATLPLDGYNRGIYILLLTTREKTYMRRIILQ